MRQTHYDTLGVPSNASTDEIKKAFRRLATELHPDKNRSLDATQRMQAVNAAHRVLSDQVLRSDYDRQIGITKPDEERQERERRQREERERQERERQQREERERQERERQQPRRRLRPWLIPAGIIGVVGVILVALVGTLIGTQEFGSQAAPVIPPTRTPTPPPVATLAPTATTAPAATPAPTATRTPAPMVTPVPTLTSAPQLMLPVPPALGSAFAVNHESVALTWENPGDTSIIGYQILRRNPDTDAAGVFALLSDDTGSADTVYVDNTAQPETRYVYRVRARNAAGFSDHSADITAITPAAPVPTPRPTATPTPTPTIVPTPTVNLAGWTTIPTLNKSGYQSRKQDINLVACVAGNFEKHRRGQTVPFSDDGSYGRSVPFVVVDVIVAGAVNPQSCYKMTLKYVTNTVVGFCDEDPYAGCDRESANYWERHLPLFRLLSIRDRWALPP